MCRKTPKEINKSQFTFHGQKGLFYLKFLRQFLKTSLDFLPGFRKFTSCLKSNRYTQCSLVGLSARTLELFDIISTEVVTVHLF